MNEIIRNKYKVEINDNSIEAKDSIIGKPTFINFKNYKQHKTKKDNIVNKLKENVYNIRRCLVP